MFRRERHADILHMLHSQHRVEVDDLAKLYQVGADSIRKDLQYLAKKGLCKRVYGGALEGDDPQLVKTYLESRGLSAAFLDEKPVSAHDKSPDEAHEPGTFFSQMMSFPRHVYDRLNEDDTVRQMDAAMQAAAEAQATEAQAGASPNFSLGHISEQDDPEQDEGRKLVAQRAYYEINDGDSIFLDLSRTNIEIAKLLAQGSKRTIVTTNVLDVIKILSTAPHITTLAIGGLLNIDLNGFVGSSTISLLEPLLFSKAFIGVGAINLQNQAVTASDVDSGSVKEKVIHNASYKFLLANKEKFGREQNYRFASITDFSAIITDSNDPVILEELQRMGTPVLRA